jgi:hypothetical protein
VEDSRGLEIGVRRTLKEIKALPSIIECWQKGVLLLEKAFEILPERKKESALKKALDVANKLIYELKNIVAELEQKLSVAYKEICDINSENDSLKKRIYTYDFVISQNNLSRYFIQEKEKEMSREDER